MKKILSAPGKLFEIDIETKKIVSFSGISIMHPLFEKLKKEYEDFKEIKLNTSGKIEIDLDIEELKKQFRDQTNGRLNNLKYIFLNQNTNKLKLVSVGNVSMLKKSSILTNDKIGSRIHFSIANRTSNDDHFICEEGVFIGRYTYVCYFGNQNEYCSTESLYLAEVGKEIYIIDKLIDIDETIEKEEIKFNHLVDIKNIKYLINEEELVVPVEEITTILRLKNQQHRFLIKGSYPKSKFS